MIDNCTREFKIYIVFKKILSPSQQYNKDDQYVEKGNKIYQIREQASLCFTLYFLSNP